jgi:hypothetical protein
MTRKIANRSATGALLALSALTSVALAEPVKLTDAQMDQVSAGAWFYDSATQNLSDDQGRVFTFSGTPGLYYGGDGTAWQAPFGIYYAAAGAHFIPDPVAYGFLVNLTSGHIWDGGLCCTF